MTATDSAPAAPERHSPPTPEECQHPSPVRGVMAHEFSAYSGAMGPEGLRRTTMHYGPVLGGLPIAAWHCETCGLLKLDYPDGRREERRLFPGPQPGLLAGTVPDLVAPEAHLGLQARVSGLTAPPSFYTELAPAAPAPFTFPAVRIPSVGDLVDGLVVLGLAATVVGLLLLAVGAVYDYTTASWEGPLAIACGVAFGSAVILKVSAAAFRHFFPWPQLAPGPVQTLRGRPRLDGVAWALVSLLVLLTLGLLLAGILAVYDWTTPSAERPLVFGLVAVFVLAVLVAVGGGTARSLRRQDGADGE